jgi:hypothetical protein
MGRVLSETATIAAMQAAESEDAAARSAADALIHKDQAKVYADAAAAAAGSVTNGGMMNANVYIYQRSAINFPPTLPSAESIYTFSDGGITGLDNGWSEDFPIGDTGAYLFVSYAIITAPNGSLVKSIEATKWNAAQLMASSGTGEATTAYWMTRSTGVIQKDTNDRYTPEAINFRAYSIQGSDPVQDYNGRFKISVTYDGTTYVQVYGSATNESNVAFTIPANIKALRVSMYLAGGLVTLLHEEMIPVVNDGISFVVKIESTNGDVFKPGESVETMLIAHVFRNGNEITADIPATQFRWRRVSFMNPQYPNDDATWNANYLTGYKQVLVTTDGIDSRATFHCDIIKD